MAANANMATKCEHGDSHGQAVSASTTGWAGVDISNRCPLVLELMSRMGSGTPTGMIDNIEAIATFRIIADLPMYLMED